MHLVNLGVHEEGPLPLADCPACAGAPDAHLNIDFCFGITTLANCAAATTRGMDPPNTRVFMDVGTSVAQLQQGVVAPNQAAADADHACSEFNAATALARKSDKVRFWRTHPHCWAHPCAACPRWPSSPSALCPRSPPQHDTTAVGTAMCRHSVVAAAVEIGTGERYIYAVAMIWHLLLKLVAVSVVWYDINCKFGIYFDRLAQASDALRSALAGIPPIRFPLPVWHKFAHRWAVHCAGPPLCALSSSPLPLLARSAACQEKHDGLYQTGVGRQYHEPNETLWSKIKGLAYLVQARTLPLPRCNARRCRAAHNAVCLWRST